MKLRPTSIVPMGLVVLVALSLSFVVLYSSLTHVLGDPATYESISTRTLSFYNEQVLTYLRGPLFSQNHLDFLTPQEQAHMNDVKRVLDIAFIIDLVCIGVLIGIIGTFAVQRLWSRFDELLGRALWICGWIVLGVCGFLAAAALLNFDRLWLLLHAILFPQGNWMFAANSTLIRMYPLEFFSSFTTKWLIRCASFGGVAVLLSLFMKRMRLADEEFTAHFEKPKRRKKR